jgi:hypothetical protein
VKAGRIRKRRRLCAARAGQVGREGDRAVGVVLSLEVARLHSHVDRHRAKTGNVVTPELFGADVERGPIRLRSTFVDGLEVDDVVHLRG